MAAKAKKGATPLTEAQFVGELVQRIGNGYSQKDVAAFLKAFKAEVADCVVLGYKVQLSGLVTFEPTVKAGKKKGDTVRNPATGETTTIKADQPDKFVVKVKRSSALNKAFPTLRTKAGQELHAKLYVKPKPKKKIAA